MSTPSPDYYQQMLTLIQLWRDLLDRSAAMTAALATNMPFLPPGMPGLPGGLPGLPPMPFAAPAGPPAPADYTQQLFGYLQAWRQQLEQMAATSPMAAQPSATDGNAPGAGNQHRPTQPPEVYLPPPDVTGSKARHSPDSSPDASQGSTPQPPEGEPASTYHSRSAAQSEPWPPEVQLAPTKYDGTFAPGYGNAVDYGRAVLSSDEPVAMGRGRQQDAAQVLRPPVYDYGNQWWIPTTLRSTGAAETAAAPAPRAQNAPAPAPAQQRTVGSPFLAAMGRVTPDASPQVRPKSLFKNTGLAQSP